MENCGTTITPELSSDKCKGCFTDTDCIGTKQTLTFLEVTEQDTLTDILVKIDNRLALLSSLIQTL